MRNYFPDPTGYAAYYRTTPEYAERLKRFAEQLHRKLCKFSHMDQCTWEYETDWDGWTHKRYLTKAEIFMSSGAPTDLILDIIEEARKL